MQAIIWVNKKSQYFNHNGKTFKIGDLLHGGAGLIGVNEQFPENQTDFSFDEILIVDIVNELAKARHESIYGSSAEAFSIVKMLNNYCAIRDIKIDIAELSKSAIEK